VQHDRSKAHRGARARGAAVQTVWKGTVSFGLVSIPVKLYAATGERDISFRQVRRTDGSRVRYRRVAEADGEEVAYSDIAKGYELPDGGMVVLTEDDLADLPVASSKAIDVLTFVPPSQIDPTTLSKAYYVDPGGEAKPYNLLYDALVDAERWAVVKISLRSRERLAVLRPRDGVLVLQTLLWPEEVRAFEVSGDQGAEIRPQERQMAASFVETMSGDFDPDEYTDDYRAALEALVAAKVEGREVAEPAEGESEGEVVDLMEALRKSVEAAKRRRESADGDTPASG
jgi:DNA end-binding protein Ku